MDVRLVDPRDIGWEAHTAVYRVSFPGYTVAAVVDRGRPTDPGPLELAVVARRELLCA